MEGGVQVTHGPFILKSFLPFWFGCGGHSHSDPPADQAESHDSKILCCSSPARIPANGDAASKAQTFIPPRSQNRGHDKPRPPYGKTGAHGAWPSRTKGE